MNVFDHDQLFQQIGLASVKSLNLIEDPSQSSIQSNAYREPHPEMIAMNQNDMTLG